MMPEGSKSPWLEFGSPSDYRRERFFLDQKKSLLYAAWAYGLGAGEEIHRLALFCFVQAHLSNIGVDSLQQVIENDSDNWKRSELIDGVYCLTERGHGRTAKFGTPLGKTHRDIEFVFERAYKGYDFSVIVTPFTTTTRKLFPAINGKEQSGVDVCKKLSSIDADFKYKITNGPTKVLCWIIQDMDFKWRLA